MYSYEEKKSRIIIFGDDRTVFSRRCV